MREGGKENKGGKGEEVKKRWCLAIHMYTMCGRFKLTQSILKNEVS